jgi:hypothetical protein
MAAVADASPLILLAKIGRLSLLSELYHQVFIPPAVANELRAKPETLSGDLERFLRPETVRSPDDAKRVQALARELGAGESEAIALAAEIPDAMLVMDDAEGRRVARGFGLRVIGLLGVLIEAKARGLLPAVGPVLDRLIAEGFWLSDAMRTMVLRSAGE